MRITKVIWFCIAALSLALGIIGAFLPLLPTVPFLLSAAVGFSKSSEKSYNWLINHSVLGKPIHDWNTKGIIKRRVKIIASFTMIGSLLLSIALSVPVIFILLETVILSAVSVFIWSKPEA